MDDIGKLIEVETDQILAGWPDRAITGPVTAVFISGEDQISNMAHRCVFMIEKRGLLTVNFTSVGKAPGVRQTEDGRLQIGTDDTLYNCPLLILAFASFPEQVKYISGYGDHFSYCQFITSAVRELASRIGATEANTRTLQ